MAQIDPAAAGGQNVLAFLDMLSVSEGTSTSTATQNDGYDVIVTGVNGPETFADYSAHPFANGRPPVVVNSRGLASTASGRYQFLVRDWAHYRNLLGLHDFGPVSQDRWAIQLIRERGALANIIAGRFAVAVSNVSNLWASLPGAGYGQPEHQLDTLAAAYQQAGGVLA